ncbi:MAG: hypothetical protein ACYCT7_04310 [bacterium]
MTDDNKNKKIEHINFIIDDELKTEFKILLLRRKKNMSAVLNELIKKYIEESKNVQYSCF